jgi:hypothetical protein
MEGTEEKHEKTSVRTAYCWQRFFTSPMHKSEVLPIRPRWLVASTLTQAMTWHITRVDVKIKGKGQPMTWREEV